jgi:hypothetical protein
MINDLEELWFNLKNSDIWSLWPGHSWNPVHGLFSEAGLVTNQPLHNLMTKTIGKR